MAMKGSGGGTLRQNRHWLKERKTSGRGADRKIDRRSRYQSRQHRVRGRASAQRSLIPTSPVWEFRCA